MKENDGETEKMSAQKRRNMLLGFGGIAIVLVAAIGYLSPNFSRSEDASGAIGAVQKHRAPQIGQNDVVLGDEQTKQFQHVLYVDFLMDAAALQNISADLASEAMSVESRTQLAAKSLDARANDLASRFQLHAKSALAAIESLGAEAALGGRADLQDLSARAASQLEASDMEALSARLNNMVAELAAAPCCGRTLQSQNLQDVEASLGAFALAAEQQTLDARGEINQLASAMEADSLGMRLRAQAAYLEAMAKEARALEGFSAALAAKSLDARSLGTMSADLLQQAEQLEARAVANMEQNLAAQAATMEALGRMQQTLDAASRSLDSRSRALDARSLESARRDLASFSTDLQSFNADLEARANVGMRSQLAAVNRHLEARSAVGSRSTLASAMPDTHNFASRARDLAARAATLDSRSR